MKKIAIATVLAVALAAPAMAASDNGQANGSGCGSPGVPVAKNPGKFFQALRELPVLQGMNPAEIANMENTTPGWTGFGQTATVGDFIQFFCGNPN